MMTLEKIEELKRRVDQAFTEDMEYVSVDPNALADLIDVAEASLRKSAKVPAPADS